MKQKPDEKLTDSITFKAPAGAKAKLQWVRDLLQKKLPLGVRLSEGHILRPELTKIFKRYRVPVNIGK